MNERGKYLQVRVQRKVDSSLGASKSMFTLDMLQLTKLSSDRLSALPSQ